MTDKHTKPKYDLAAIEAKLPGDRTMAEQLALARSKRRPMTRESARNMVRIREALRAARETPPEGFTVAKPDKEEPEE